MRCHNSLFWIGIVLLSGVSACASESPLVPRSTEAFVYVVLSPESLIGETLVDGTLRALLMTAGLPTASTFRRAERFEMRRAQDGAVFIWRESDPSPAEQTIGYRGIDLNTANYILPRTASGTDRGRSDIRPGDVYTLTIDTEGAAIRGAARIPQRPVPLLVTEGLRRVVAWSDVPGAAGYYVTAETEAFSGGLYPRNSFELRYDRLRDVVPPNPKFTVIALDSNLFRYLTDTTLASAGLTGALGLFGAATPAELVLPRDPP